MFPKLGSMFSVNKRRPGVFHVGKPSSSLKRIIMFTIRPLMRRSHEPTAALAKCLSAEATWGKLRPLPKYLSTATQADLEMPQTSNGGIMAELHGAHAEKRFVQTLLLRSFSFPAVLCQGPHAKDCASLGSAGPFFRTRKLGELICGSGRNMD